MKGLVRNSINVAIIKQLPLHMWTPCREHIEAWGGERPECTVDECYEELNRFIHEKYATKEAEAPKTDNKDVE